MRYYIYTLILTGIVFFTSSCTDVIDVDLKEADNLVVVDAWVDNLEMLQTINLSYSQTYFDSSEYAILEDAVVTITNQTQSIDFLFNHETNGQYQYLLETGEQLGEVGDILSLTVDLDGKTLSSTVQMHRTTPIDTLKQFEREGELGFNDGTYCTFFARDQVGLNDAYWIKAIKNDQLLNQPFEINIAYDAAFDPGGQIDGITFIQPIRDAINPIENLNDPNDVTSPYVPGDMLEVQIHSLSLEAFSFIETVRDQLQNSANGIFALPLSNARTNISSSTDEEVLGIFNVAAVSTRTILIE